MALRLSCPMTFGILGPQSGIKPAPRYVGRQILNHWTTREVPELCGLGEFLYSSSLGCFHCLALRASTAGTVLLSSSLGSPHPALTLCSDCEGGLAYSLTESSSKPHEASTHSTDEETEAWGGPVNVWGCTLVKWQSLGLSPGTCNSRAHKFLLQQAVASSFLKFLFICSSHYMAYEILIP